MSANRVLPRLRRRLRFPALTFTGAVAALIIGSTYGALQGHGLHGLVIALTATVVFLALGVTTVRRLSTDLAETLSIRVGPARASVLALISAVCGYALTALVTLDMLRIPISQLLLGGAITGVILGIAAQQSLGNLAAGLVLLLARPFTVGDHITVHSGALGGPHTGVVTGGGLTYVQLHTTHGTLQLPNAALLAAAINPTPHNDIPDTTDAPAPAGARTPAAATGGGGSPSQGAETRS